MPTLSHPNFLVSAGIHLLTSEALFPSAHRRIPSCATARTLCTELVCAIGFHRLATKVQ